MPFTGKGKYFVKIIRIANDNKTKRLFAEKLIEKRTKPGYRIRSGEKSINKNIGRPAASPPAFNIGLDVESKGLNQIHRSLVPGSFPDSALSALFQILGPFFFPPEALIFIKILRNSC